MKRVLLIALSFLLTLSLCLPASALILVDDEGNIVDPPEATEGELVITNLLGELPGFDMGLQEPNLPTLPPASMFGTIVEVLEGGSLLVQNGFNEEDTVILHLSDHTFVLDAVTGTPASIDSRTTDRVAVFYGPMTTFSIPPQSPAVAIAINLPEGQFSPHYAVVESIQRDEDSVRILTGNGSLYITINRDTPLSPYRTRNIVTIDALRIGSVLMVWYDIVAMSYPGQTMANKAVLLQNGPAPDLLTYDLEAGTAIVNSAELELTAVQTAEDGSALLPLRQICEAMGYTVTWVAETNSIEIAREDSPVVSLAFDSAEALRNGVPFSMTRVPVVENWVTLVPADFFTHILFAEVEAAA